METVALFSQDGGKWGFIKVKQMVRKLTYVLARNIKNTLSGDMGSFHDHDVPFAVCLVPKKSIVKMFPGKKFFHHSDNNLDSNKTRK